MKVRTCFVSNSSSSSFIVKVPNYRQLQESERLQEFRNIMNDDYYNSCIPAGTKTKLITSGEKLIAEGWRLMIMSWEFGGDDIHQILKEFDSKVWYNIDGE